ncbi:hypothetical protein B0T22DRAFT_373070 [Podospora appendiculata]|uniref:pH-response regulator protein palC n=1 Tax=Podospora appendiculata TaxID=314037 RepID=A0AAE0XKH4_9PEZI|nr:hypothetical protein B0T22DRAFT_373070 [Podospora appendiculata]
MPYPYTLPTTSAFSFSPSLVCDSHPSLPLHTSTRRGVVRDTLKAHKRLAPSAQSPHLWTVASSLQAYLPYLFAIDAGLGHRAVRGDEIHVILQTAPALAWRPTLSSGAGPIPGKDPPRVKVHSLEYEVFFALAALASAHTLQARAALHPLYLTTTAPVGTQQRQTAIAAATKHLLDAASILDYAAARAGSLVASPPCPDISPAALHAQSALALAEATLLAVLKDDPYPAVVAQDRNANDTEWMYKAPTIPKVRAHLFARLCLAASEHAAHAHSLCAAGAAGGRINDAFVKYLDDLRRTSRARACRFFGIDSELGGQTGTAIAWLWAGLHELGVQRKDETSSKKSSGGGGGGFGRLKKEWTEKREDRKVERELNWGADAGRIDEIRVIEMLEAKWTKQNDTMGTQAVPPTGPLLAQMPSGREIHTLKPFQPPLLDAAALEAMRAPPDRSDDAGGFASSDEETLAEAPARGDYRTGTPNYY